MAAVVELHEKRPALPEKLKELQTKGRKINSNAQTSNDYASKKNGMSQGQVNDIKNNTLADVTVTGH